jgi:hypothetical protein
MIWLRASIPFAIPLTVIAFLWNIPVEPEAVAASDGLSDLASRSIGFGLLTVAFLAIGFIVYSVRAPSPQPQERPVPLAFARHEFRRGFGTGRLSGPAHNHRERDPKVVVALPRRQTDLPAATPVAVSRSTPQESIESLTKRLHERAKTLWNARAV